MKVKLKDAPWGRVIYVNDVEVGRVVGNVVSLDVYSPNYPWEGSRVNLGWAGSLIYAQVKVGEHAVELIGHEHDGVKELISVRVILSRQLNDDELSSLVINLISQYMGEELLSLIMRRRG